ncbi:hypothetical protein [Streptosporangium sp. NPDC051022]|uniref:hypothetical protein n=1 Tax=Streptosporangium sp. NPDC051022 TaxID=3155752 RepID=UPI0034180243
MSGRTRLTAPVALALAAVLGLGGTAAALVWRLSAAPSPAQAAVPPATPPTRVAATPAQAVPPSAQDGSPPARTASPPARAAAGPAFDRPVIPADRLADRAGIRLVRVSASGAGGLLDVRYQVVDPGRAQAVHQESTPPLVVDEASGLVIRQLYMGHAHTGELKPAVTYYLVFENSGNWVRPGSKVTVLLGDAQVRHVTVS